MSNIVEAEYKVVQERTLPVIASEILQIEENVGRVALDGAIRIGERLKEAKEKVEHGQWENWCRDNLNYSKSKTEKLMKIAAEYGDENSPYAKTYMCTDLSISKALRLLQVPEDEVESFVGNHDVEDMTVKELEKEIGKLKEQIIVTDEENDRYREEADRYEAEISEQKAKIAGYIEEIEDLKASGADPEKIAELESELEKQKNKVKKLQDDIKAEKKAKEQAVTEAVEKKEAALLQKAEEAVADKLKEARKEREELLEKVAQLEKKIQNSSNENTLMFKLKVDQLQEVFDECEEAIEAEPEKARRSKMTSALATVLDAMRGGL